MSKDLTEPGGLTRLYLDAPLAGSGTIALNEDQSHYLARVLRAQVGAHVRLFNGRDGEWRAQIAEIGKKGVKLAVEARTLEQVGVPNLWLLVAPIKRTPLDYVTQKAAELGVAVIQPVITRRTIVERVNTDRMRANAVEAAEQSGRLTVPEVRDPLALDKVIAKWDAARPILFCDEAGEAPSIHDALLKHKRGPWAIITGPEGGFDPSERDMLRARNFVVPVSLGPRIMRADTAAIAALAVWQSTLGDWT